MLRKKNNENKIKTISLFSGAGGLDIGAILGGANIVWANDIMKEACETYRKNIGDHIKEGNIEEHLDELEEFKNIDLVIGGPPCQGFSVAGKMKSDDPRSKLIWTYCKVISMLKPKAFIMENVKALGTLQKWADIRSKLINELESYNYNVELIILNASDFDVPQARERIFIIGVEKSINQSMPINTLIEQYKTKAKTVRETLKQLDRAGTGNNKSLCNAKITLAQNPILRKSPYSGMLFNGLGRPTKLDGYSATLPASMGGNKTPIIDDNELYNNEQAWIINYHNDIMQHNIISQYKEAPSFLRRMTVEEAALIQTFPLYYDFAGSQSSKYTQIGNAVPCNLGKAVVRMVIDIIKKL